MVIKLLEGFYTRIVEPGPLDRYLLFADTAGIGNNGLVQAKLSNTGIRFIRQIPDKTFI